jgi:hypothetical protein
MNMLNLVTRLGILLHGQKNAIFAYSRGSYPIEYAPDIDLDIQFAKSILSPTIIEPLGPYDKRERLSVVN